MARPVPARVRDMHAAYEKTGSLGLVAHRFGVTKGAVWMAFCRHGLLLTVHRIERAPLSKSDLLSVRAKNKAWCGQCEKRVAAVDVRRCASPFCKARVFLPPQRQGLAHSEGAGP